MDTIMNRLLTLLVFSMIALNLNANMASPILEGTKAGLTFISTKVNVVSEVIYIQPDRDFDLALIEVEYIIESDSSALKIPIIFHAKGYESDISISFDGKKINIENCLSVFHNNMKDVGINNSEDGVFIKWSEDDYQYEIMNDLKYFEVDISKGRHKINVSYNAYSWIDRSDWVKAKSFRYSLFPIKYWKSVGDIELIVDLEKLNLDKELVTTNLGIPAEEKNEGAIKKWLITDLDKDYIKLDFKAKMSTLSKLLIKISPGGLAFIFTIIFSILHFKFIKTSLNRGKAMRRWIIFLGGIVVPILGLIVFMLSFSLIDFTLQGHASSYYGYIFLPIFLLPLFIFVYLVLSYWYSRRIQSKTIS